MAKNQTPKSYAKIGIIGAAVVALAAGGIFLMGGNGGMSAD